MHGYGILFFLVISSNLLTYARREGNVQSSQDQNEGTKQSEYAVYPFPNPVILDLSNVGEFVHTEAKYHDWTTFITSPTAEENMVKVVDDGSTVWEGDGKTEKCFSVTRHIKGDVDILDINLFTRAGKCTHKFFEKNGGVWKSIEKEEFDERKPKSESYTRLDGTEFGVRVEYNPVEDPKDLTFCKVEQSEEAKKESAWVTYLRWLDVFDCVFPDPDGPAFPGLLPSTKPEDSKSKASQSTPENDKPSEADDPPNPETNEESESEKKPADAASLLVGISGDAKIVDSTLDSFNSSTGDLTKLDIKKPNTHVVKLVETLDKNGLRHRMYSRTGTSPITSVVDGSFEFYKGETEVKTVLSFSKDDYTLIFIQYTKTVNGHWATCFESSGGKWVPLSLEEYNAKLKAMRGLEVLKPLDNPHIFKTKPLKKEVGSTKSQAANAPVTEKVKLQFEGIDPEKFVLEKFTDEDISVLKCSSKIGVTPSDFSIGSNRIWSGKEGFHMVTATIYLEDDEPKIAFLKIRSKDLGDEFVYSYKYANGWKEICEKMFNKRLDKMKNPSSCDESILDMFDPNPATCRSLNIDIDGVPSSVFIMETGAVVNVVQNSDDNVWMSAKGDACSYCVAFMKGGNPKMALVRTMTDKGASDVFYRFKRGRWEVYTKNYGAKIDKLRDFLQSTMLYLDIFGNGDISSRKGCSAGLCWVVSWIKYGWKLAYLKIKRNAPIRFSMDISVTENAQDENEDPPDDDEDEEAVEDDDEGVDDKNFVVVKEEKDGLTTHHYSAKPGYVVDKVVEGDVEIWVAQTDQICFLCEVHSVGNSKLLRLHIKSGKYEFSFQTFGYSGNKWKNVTEGEFGEILARMKQEATIRQPPQEPEKPSKLPPDQVPCEEIVSEDVTKEPKVKPEVVLVYNKTDEEIPETVSAPKVIPVYNKTDEEIPEWIPSDDDDEEDDEEDPPDYDYNYHNEDPPESTLEDTSSVSTEDVTEEEDEPVPKAILWSAAYKRDLEVKDEDSSDEKAETEPEDKRPKVEDEPKIVPKRKRRYKPKTEYKEPETKDIPKRVPEKKRRPEADHMEAVVALPKYSDLEVDGLETVELDIANADPERFIIDKFSLKGIPSKTFEPLEEYYVTRVSEYDLPIWKASHGKTLLEITVYYNFKVAISALVFSLDVYGQCVTECFNKVNGRWIHVSKVSHKNVLAKLKTIIKPSKSKCMDKSKEVVIWDNEPNFNYFDETADNKPILKLRQLLEDPEDIPLYFTLTKDESESPSHSRRSVLWKVEIFISVV